MAKALTLDVVQPAGSVFKGEVARFRAPGTTGSFEILKDHATMLAQTQIGAVYITTPDGERIVLASGGGFVQVADNRIIMIAESAEPSTKIDVDRARRAEERATVRLDLNENLDRMRAERSLERARNRLRIAVGSVGTVSR